VRRSSRQDRLDGVLLCVRVPLRRSSAGGLALEVLEILLVVADPCTATVILLVCVDGSIVS